MCFETIAYVKAVVLKLQLAPESLGRLVKTQKVWGGTPAAHASGSRDHTFEGTGRNCTGAPGFFSMKNPPTTTITTLDPLPWKLRSESDRRSVHLLLGPRLNLT